MSTLKRSHHAMTRGDSHLAPQSTPCMQQSESSGDVHPAAESQSSKQSVVIIDGGWRTPWMLQERDCFCKRCCKSHWAQAMSWPHAFEGFLAPAPPAMWWNPPPICTAATLPPALKLVLDQNYLCEPAWPSCHLLERSLRSSGSNFVLQKWKNPSGKLWPCLLDTEMYPYRMVVRYRTSCAIGGYRIVVR